MGPLKAGRYNFDWDAADYEGATLRFKVVAANGETAVASTTLMRDKVSAVSMDNGTLYLQLKAAAPPTTTASRPFCNYCEGASTMAFQQGLSASTPPARTWT
jgi:flagellar hook assembly protein FlgD